MVCKGKLGLMMDLQSLPRVPQNQSFHGKASEEGKYGKSMNLHTVSAFRGFRKSVMIQ